MGGGEFVRAAAKMAGAGVFNAGLRRASNVPKFEQLLRGSSRPTSVAAASSPSLQQFKAAVGTEVETVQKPAWEVDDWEFATLDDDLASGPKPRIVFGFVPSFEEAKEATADLKEALDKVYLSSPESCGLNRSVSSSNCELETKPCLIIESSPHASVPNHALQAFKLLKESAEAQTVVASIASDPKVWNAMLHNEELRSFLKSYETNEGLQSQKLSDELEDALDASNAKESGNIFSDMVGYVKTKISDMVANASSLLQKIFGSPAKEVCGDDKATPAKMTMGASIMGLVVLVIMVLVTKRN